MIRKRTYYVVQTSVQLPEKHDDRKDAEAKADAEHDRLALEHPGAYVGVDVLEHSEHVQDDIGDQHG